MKTSSISESVEVMALELKKMELSEADNILNLLSMSSCKKLAINPITNLQQARCFVLGQNSSHDHRFSIYHNEYGLIGAMSFEIFNGQDQKQADISYWLAECFQRQGFGHIALILLMEKLAALGVVKVNAYVYVYRYNVASQRLLSKVGFNCEQDISMDKALSPMTKLKYVLLLC